MSFGIIELITLLLGLAGFGVQPNPKAPTPEQSLQYAMSDADVVMHFDAVSVIPNNFKVLKNLPNHPQIKASPGLANAVRQAIGEVEGARGLAKVATGIDLVTDISDATLFIRIVPQQDPAVIATVHGRFTTAVVDKIAKMSKGTVSKVGAGMMVETGTNDPAIGVTRDGIMLAGTASLVRDRLGDAWRAPARPPGSNLAYTAEVLAAKPLYALVLTMSPGARTEAVSGLGGKNVVTDVIQRHKMASFSVFHDGIGWSWIDRSKGGLESMAMMSEGMLELLRAAHIAPRGVAKLALGAIDSYRGTDRRVDDLIRRKADIVKIIETYTGDGSFATKIDRDPKTLRLTVRATGKSLSQVVPAGVLLPGLAWAMLSRGTASPPPPPPAKLVAPPPPSRPGAKPRPTTPSLGAPKNK